MNFRKAKRIAAFQAIFTVQFRAIIWVVLCLLVLSTAIHLWPQLSIDTDIVALLPRLQQSEAMTKAIARKQSLYNRKIIVLIGGHTLDSTLLKTREIATLAESCASFENVEWQYNFQEKSKTYQVLYPYRYLLLTPTDKLSLVESTEKYIENIYRSIHSPLGFQYTRSIISDPLQVFSHYLEQFQPSTLFIYDDIPFIIGNTNNQSRYYALMTLTIQPITTPDLYSDIYQFYQQIQSIDTGSDNEILMTGLPLYSAFGHQSAKAEITIIGIISIIGIITLIVFFFRSITPLMLALISIAFGILSAFTACLLVFKTIHIITLIFGSSLIGISIDYSFHYFSDYFNPHKKNSLGHLSIVSKGMTLGMTSSVLAFSGLYFTPFSGLKQIAVFSGTGLVGAWLTVILLFPAGLQRFSIKHTIPIHQVISFFLVRWPSLYHRHYRFFLIGTGIYCLFGLTAVRAVDDIHTMQTINSELVKQESQIAAMVNQSNGMQFFLVSGETIDTAMAAEIHLMTLLDKAIENQQLDRYKAISQHYISAKEQQQNYRLLLPLFEENTVYNLLTTLNLPKTMIEQIYQDFKNSPHYLPITRWLEAMPDDIQTLWSGCESDTCYSMISLAGVKSNTAMMVIADQSSQFMFVNPIHDVKQTLKRYRHIASLFIIIAFLIIFSLLTLVLGLRSAAIIIRIPAVAILITLATLGFLKTDITLFNVFALLLVLGISLDYAIFHFLGANQKASTFLAIFLSLLTTLMAFGLLALSQTAVIHAFGLTLGLGVLTAFIITPLSFRLDSQETINEPV